MSTRRAVDVDMKNFVALPASPVSARSTCDNNTETAWYFRTGECIQYEDDKAYESLPHRRCPACGSRPQAIPCPSVKGCARSGLTSHVKCHGHSIVVCAGENGQRHLWWPSINRVYSVDEALKNGWVFIWMDGALYGTKDEGMFWRGVSVANSP